MFKSMIPLLLGAAVVTPLFLSSPAQAQSYERIQNLEERIQDARQQGAHGHAAHLRRQLNRERLQYQRRHNLGEVRQRNDYNNRYYPNRRGYYDRRGTYNPGGYYDRNRGYYNRRGYWFSN